MKFKFLITLLLLSFQMFSQSITKENLIGEWVIETASVSSKMFSQDETELMDKIKSVFIGGHIFFSKNDLIKMELNGHLPEPFNYKMFDKVFYYELKNDFVKVGHKKNSSSIMIIEVRKEADKFVLNFLGVEVGIKQLETSSKLQFDKETARSLSTISPSKPLMFDYIEESDVITLDSVEQMPISYDCDETLDSETLRKCISNSMANHVNHKFNTDLAAELGVSGIIRIESEFVIDKDGDIINIISTSPNAELSNEAIRVINTIPRFRPAKINNIPVSVSYKFPIVFQIVE